MIVLYNILALPIHLLRFLNILTTIFFSTQIPKTFISSPWCRK